MPIKQSVTLNTTAAKVYEVLTTSAQFCEVTGAPAEISCNEGGAFSCFGGQISGRQIELSPSDRIVQAWRAGSWPEGVYSIVKFEINESGSSTTVDLEHVGFPDAGGEHLEGGWHKMYWEPLKSHFA